MTSGDALQPSQEALKGIADASKKLLDAVAELASAKHVHLTVGSSADRDRAWQLAKNMRDAESRTKPAIESLVEAHLKAIRSLHSPKGDVSDSSA